MLDSKKRLISKSALIISWVTAIALAIAALLFVDFLLKRRLDLPFNVKSIEETNLDVFNRNKDVIDTLILGDSHPGQSLVNLLPGNWFKATHAGEDMESMLLKLEYYSKNSDKIKYLIIPLDYHTLNGTWGVPKQEYDIYRRTMMTPLTRVSKLFDDYNRKIAVNWFFSKLNNKIFKTQASQSKPATGWEEISENDPELLKKVAVRAKGMLHEPIINNNSVLTIEKISEIAKSKGILLIGVRYPLPNDYIKYANENRLNRIDAWIEKNKKMFHKIFDYRYVFKDEQYYFGNEDHLNIPGSNKFTTIFVSDYFKSIYRFKGEGLNKIPKAVPNENSPLISVTDIDARLLNIESPYGIEKDGVKSWYWLGKGERQGINIRLYTNESKTVSVYVEYETPLSIAGKFGGQDHQVVDGGNGYSKAIFYLKSGLNDISFSSPEKTGLIQDTGPRNLVIKVGKMVISGI